MSPSGAPRGDRPEVASAPFSRRERCTSVIDGSCALRISSGSRGRICLLTGLAGGSSPVFLLTAGAASRAAAAIEALAGRALAAGLSLPLLGVWGYAPGRQDAQALMALSLAYGLLPCVLKLLAALAA